ncbi:hypothetical protein [Micromonospora okii]|uniref:hypothetical protein n=1 Tax=Micromonospora okii TaxID=1182970 RepID=UPI001E447710|nr:hypothetical protein [Micromonospora okii]
MGRSTWGGRALARTAGVLAAGAVAGATAARALPVPRWAERPRAARDARPDRWQVVTVDRPPEWVLPGGRWPEPLRRLGGAVEVALRPAPGGRGTELAARPAGTPLPGMAAHVVGDDPGPLLRQALRQVKQLAETGEVLRADPSPLDGPQPSHGPAVPG